MSAEGSERRAEALVVGVGGILLIFGTFLAAEAAVAWRLPGHARLLLLGGEIFGLALPALALLALARAAGLLGPRRRRATTPHVIAGVAVWTFAAGTLAGIASACAFTLAAPDAAGKLLGFYERALDPIIAMASPGEAAAVLVLVTILPALCEELAFRGFLQRVLRSGFSAVVSIALTSVLFAAFHLDPIGFPTRVIVGVGAGLCYERTGSLGLSMIVHGTHNLLVMLLTPGGDDPMAHMTRAQAALGLAVTLPGTAVAGWLWLRSLRRLPAPEP